MLLKVFSDANGPSYKYAEEVHPTAIVRSKTASYRVAAREAPSVTARENVDVGRGSGAVGLLCVTHVLGRFFAGTACSVEFLKHPRPSLCPYSPKCLEVRHESA
jgi:hypothetical protein